MAPRPALLAVLVLTLVPALVRAEQVAVLPAPPQPPVRDQVPESRVPATAVIRGRVVDGVTGQPVPRARVRLPGRPPTGNRTALTNSEGAFEFTQVPAGAFSLSVEKSTYMSTSYPEGSRTLRGNASRLPSVLTAGKVVEDLVIRMYRGASISGRVFDVHGDPIESATISVLRVVGGPTRSVSSTQANDLGEFRIPRLQPGSYLLYASGKSGGRSEPDLQATGEPMPEPMPTYYPGVMTPDQAQVITLERGQSLAGLDLVMHEGTPVLINGMVVRSDGAPVSGGYVNSRLSTRELPGIFNSGASVRPDGTFRMTLAPGVYVLQANTFTQTPSQGPSTQRTEQNGMARVSVGANPVQSVTIQTGPGASATGRIVFEGAAAPAKPPAGLSVPFSSPDSGGCRSAQAHVADDWTFKIDGLMGTCAAPSSLLFGKWTLKSVQHRGEELLHRTLTFEPGQQLTNVQLLFTDKRSEVEFRVSDANGQPTRDYVAIAFPADKERWTPWTPFARTFVPVSNEMLEAAKLMGRPPPPRAGRESLALTPGDYYVVALDDVEREEFMLHTFLERLIQSAQRITVGEGVNQEVDLRRVMREDVIR